MSVKRRNYLEQINFSAAYVRVPATYSTSAVKGVAGFASWGCRKSDTVSWADSYKAMRRTPSEKLAIDSKSNPSIVNFEKVSPKEV